jgi:hypothetical protein
VTRCDWLTGEVSGEKVGLWSKKGNIYEFSHRFDYCGCSVDVFVCLQ